MYEKQKLARAKDGVAPQYYNAADDRFEVAQGVNGKLHVSDDEVRASLNATNDGCIMDSFEGSGSTKKTYPTDITSVTVVNDGSSDVKLTVRGLDIIVKRDEIFCDRVPRESRIINLFGEKYRVIVKGVTT